MMAAAIECISPTALKADGPGSSEGLSSGPSSLPPSESIVAQQQQSTNNESTPRNNLQATAVDSSQNPMARLPSDEIRTSSLGAMAVLPDSILFDIFGMFEAEELCTASLVSKVFYIFAEEDEHWRDICLKKFGGDFTFKGCWKRTVLMPREKPAPSEPYRKLAVMGFYSDFLYARWYRGNCDLSRWKQLPPNLPEHLKVEKRSGLSKEEFIEEYVKKNKPVILTDVVPKWRGWKNKSWTREALIRRFGDTLFRIDQPDEEGNKLHMKLADYFAYAKDNHDQDPIYVFCPFYGERAPALLSDYEVPEYFTEDFFSLLGRKRPSYRWVVMGCARSGSAFHLDPFKTSAWNSLLVGRKRWALYPPGIAPPGLDWEQDDNGKWDYTGEDPIKWYLHYYDQAANHPDPRLRPIEVIQEEGEMIYVPSNWWHAVFNIEEAIAVTQNFCDSHCFADVYEDMKWDNDHYYRHLYFTERMLRVRPDVMKLEMIHPGFWTRQGAVEERKARKAYRRTKAELREEWAQLDKWLEGASPEMRPIVEAQIAAKKSEGQAHLADLKRRTNECYHPLATQAEVLGQDSAVETGGDKDEQAFSAANFWRQPLPSLDDLLDDVPISTIAPEARLPHVVAEPEVASCYNHANFWRAPHYELEVV